MKYRASAMFGLAGANGNRRSIVMHACTALLATFAMFVAACGGGTDGTGRTGGDHALTSSGVMTRGSVILNGVKFEADGARVTDDRGRTPVHLDTGMVIKLRGLGNDAGAGRAEQIDVENEVRAPIASLDGTANPRRLVVAGVIVMAYDETVYANVSGFDALAAGMRVEVHGLRDSAGWLHATRIEAVGAAGADEVRGRIASIDTTNRRVTLQGGVSVRYASAAFSPSGTGEGSLMAGAVIEARGTLSGNTLAATQVDIESLEDADYRGAANEKQDVEGFVAGYSSHPGEFMVNGRTVRSTPATKFNGGNAGNLANDIHVEVQGRIDAQGTLVADRIRFKRARTVLQGLATTVSVAGRTLGLLGQSVQANDMTRVIGPGPSIELGDIVAGVHCVEVQGYAEGMLVVADRIRRLQNCGRDVVQARVAAKNATTFTLGFFGGSLTGVTTPNTTYRGPGGTDDDDDDDGSGVLTREQFFSRVTPAGADSVGTLVRLQGTWVAGVLTIDTAEIDDE